MIGLVFETWIILVITTITTNNVFKKLELTQIHYDHIYVVSSLQECAIINHYYFSYTTYKPETWTNLYISLQNAFLAFPECV